MAGVRAARKFPAAACRLTVASFRSTDPTRSLAHQGALVVDPSRFNSFSCSLVRQQSALTGVRCATVRTFAGTCGREAHGGRQWRRNLKYDRSDPEILT